MKFNIKYNCTFSIKGIKTVESFTIAEFFQGIESKIPSVERY